MMTKKAILFWLAIIATAAAQTADLPRAGESKVVRFDSTLPVISEKVFGIDYYCDFTRQRFELFVPENYTGQEAFGLCVFIDARKELKFPPAWAEVMKRHKIIMLIPQDIGNDVPWASRAGIALNGILKVIEKYRVDPKRICCSGFSGGARCAVRLAFLHSEIFSQCIGVCGADFYERVPKMVAADTAGYGFYPIGSRYVTRARENCRFVFVTGEKDFRRGVVTDIFNGGFVKNGFRAKLIDVPGMDHELCDVKTLDQAFAFLEQ